MVPRLWVPLTHWLWARNWKPAAWGVCLTASRVANRVAVSTPLRIGSWTSAVVAVAGVLSVLGPGGGLRPVAGVGQAVASRRAPGTGRAASAAASLSMAALSCFWSAMNAGTGG